MRLGASRCRLVSGSKAFEAYRREEISERHRHRYEFNNRYREAFEKKGMLISGVYAPGELAEVIELKDHPWFIACQYHPEFKSRPLQAHPLFRELVRAALQRQSVGRRPQSAVAQR